MSAVRLLPREIVEHELRSLGCKPVGNLAYILTTGSIWVTPWGFHFMVPEEGPEKRCDEYTFRAILAEIAAQKPLDN